MRVRASSLNYRDLMVLKRGGRGPTKLGIALLSNGAGEVAAVGDGVARVKVGNRVAGTFHPRWFGGPIKARLVHHFMPLRIGRANVPPIGNQAIRTGMLLVG